MQPKYDQREMTDRELIELAARELATRQGFADPKEMRQRDLEYLCERIEETSGILISLSTIRRILNGQFNRLPQVATLNALAAYLGCPDWQGFKAVKRPFPKPGPTRTRLLSLRDSGRIAGAGVVVLLLIILLSWSYFSKSPQKADAPAAFSIRKTTQNAIPNTVVFTYDIDHMSGDSFFIQQSWDRNRRVRIYKNSHTLTDIYYEPGYHTAKLLVNDQVVKTMDVSIPTDKWFFYCKESFTHGLPAYIHSDSPIHSGILGLDRQSIVANRIDPEKPQIYLYTWFPTTIGADADNFRLFARIRMKDLRNTACPFIMSEIYCQRGFMYSTYTMPGCTGGLRAQFGEQLIDGVNNDLSALAFDVHQWHRLEIVNRDRRVIVSIDGKSVMTKQYSSTAGRITGLGFHSNGLCEADSIELTGLDGKDGLDGKKVYPQ
jgi:transcriptional regulator with XRE-family HTH domain